MYIVTVAGYSREGRNVDNCGDQCPVLQRWNAQCPIFMSGCVQLDFTLEWSPLWTLVMPDNRVTSLSNVQSPCPSLTQTSVYCPACVSFYASKPVTILGGDVKCPVSKLCAKYWNRNHLQQWKGNTFKMCSYTVAQWYKRRLSNMQIQGPNPTKE